MTKIIASGKRIFRFTVPVDNNWHKVEFDGEILSVGCRTLAEVEFWAVEPDTRARPNRGDKIRAFRVVGTGHQMPDDVVYRGTAKSPDNQFIWHLIELL